MCYLDRQQNTAEAREINIRGTGTQKGKQKGLWRWTGEARESKQRNTERWRYTEEVSVREQEVGNGRSEW